MREGPWFRRRLEAGQHATDVGPVAEAIGWGKLRSHNPGFVAGDKPNLNLYDRNPSGAKRWHAGCRNAMASYTLFGAPPAGPQGFLNRSPSAPSVLPRFPFLLLPVRSFTAGLILLYPRTPVTRRPLAANLRRRESAFSKNRLTPLQVSGG